MINDHNIISQPRNNRPIASSMIFNHTNQYSPTPQQIDFNNIPQRRQFTQSSPPINISSRHGLTTQSMIFPVYSQQKTKPQGFSKLDSLARIVPSNNTEDILSTNINTNFDNNFQRQMPTRHEFNNSNNKHFQSRQVFPQNKYQQQTRKLFQPIQSMNRRRKQSWDVEGSPIQIVQQKRNLQFIPKNINFTEKYQDCQSTNSGSGSQFFKTKNFDFLKKKKDSQQSNQLSNQNNVKSVQQFQSMKKSQIIWPLSISPMEQKSAQQGVRPSNLQSNNGHRIDRFFSPQPTLNNIQFKKKKIQNFPSRFQPTKNNQLQMPVRKTRSFRQITIDDFQIKDKIGKGAFGDVFLAQQKNIGFICVLKKMSKKHIKQAKVEQHIIRQIKLQSYLANKHITTLYGYFHDDQHIYLVLQLLSDGSLQQIKKKKKLPEKQTADYIKQVAAGLKYMHDQQVIHRDLKPQNVFVHEGLLKIGDFGCSIFHNDTTLRNTIVGCLQYSSPQQLSQQGYNIKIDSWSLGIMTYQLLFGKSPFESEIKKIIANQDKKAQLSEIVFPPAIPIRQQAKQFILNLLNANPDLRMDMDQALFHPFLKD